MAQTREDQQKVKISFFFIFVHRVVKFSGCSPYSYWLFENIYTIKSIQFLFYLGSDYWMGGGGQIELFIFEKEVSGLFHYQFCITF